MSKSKYSPTGHLKAGEDIPESQRIAIRKLAADGHSYRRIFAMLRNIAPHDVTESELICTAEASAAETSTVDDD